MLLIGASAKQNIVSYNWVIRNPLMKEMKKPKGKGS